MKTAKSLELPKRGKFRRRNVKSSLKIITNNSVINKENLPSQQSLTYGVLGIGRLGSTLAINLMKMKKVVYIWNRTNSKCVKLLEELSTDCKSFIKICYIPARVIKKSDIIFNCISDCQGSKDVIESSLAKELASRDFMMDKGLIDMSGLDPDGQKKLFELVKDKGGQYLEVRIQIKNDYIGGGYIFLVGGNAELFHKCESLFEVLGAKPVYFDQEIGYVTKLNLSLQLMKSVYLTGLTEGYSLLERMIPPQKQHDLLKIFFVAPFFGDYIKSKVVMILQKKFGVVEQSLKNLKKDLKSSLDLSESASGNVDMWLSSVTYQVFKHSEKLGYGDLDPSAIFMRFRH